jgi:hypothetical protein
MGYAVLGVPGEGRVFGGAEADAPSCTPTHPAPPPLALH